MKSTKYMLFCLVFYLLVVSCSSSKTSIQTPTQLDNDTRLVGTNNSEVPEGDAVVVENPGYDPWFQFQSICLYDTAVSRAVGDSYILKGGDFPSDYEALITDGLLPVIFKNRYTGDSLKNSEKYSLGDIYYKTDLSSGVKTLILHQGPQDYEYAPDLTGGEWKSWVTPDSETKFNGKSLKTVSELGLDLINNITQSDTANLREYYFIPADDDARVNVYITYVFVNYLMYNSSLHLDELPNSVEAYIDLVGEKNPVAWINPYTSAPMEEVPWVKVPQYFSFRPTDEPIEVDVDESSLPDDSLAGNYSYTYGFSPVLEGAMRSYAQFYFKEPDGSISAYIAIGMTSADLTESSFNMDGWF